MTRTIERSYPQSPRELVTTLLDQAYLDARSENLGGTAPPTVTFENGVTVVRFPRRLPLDDVPGPLRALAGNGLLTHTERWEAIADDRCAATWTTESTLPGRMTGTYEIVAGEDGSTYTVVATAKVNVPLVGGRLAHEVEEFAVMLIAAELDFLAAWPAT